MKKKVIFVILIVLVFLPIENYFSKESVYATNWGISALFYIVSWVSIVLSVVFLVCNFFKVSIIILVSGILLVVPFNIYQLNDLRILKDEGDRIVHDAYQYKLKTGSYPEDFHSKDSRIVYDKDRTGSFMVSFYVFSSSGGHFYTPKDGWVFMDD